MKSKIIGYAMSVGATFLPLIALAQSGPNTSRIFALVGDLKRLLDLLIPIAITIALLFFIWGLAMFILASGDEEKRKEGKQRMIWGVIALFIMASIWGLVRFIQSATGVTENENIDVPGVNLP